MSTRSSRPVFVEFPDFGFGPAATTLAVLEHAPIDTDWHLVTTGSAGRFARQELSHVTYHDVDTFDPACWHRFLDVAPSGGLVISNTNPNFAAWAVGRGYEVGVIDTLDWMWSSLPAGIEGARFHLVQAFFGCPPAVYNSAQRAETVAPVVDSDLWRSGQESPQRGSVVIGFGGMHVPGHENLIADYVRWFLEASLPVLVEEIAATDVAIVGGRADLTDLVPQRWARHTCVRSLSAVPRREYARLCREAEHLLIAPGLTSIYECAAGGLSPFLQPGFNMSMAFQSLRICQTGYPHACAWPWLDEVTDALIELPEKDGVAHVAECIRDTLEDSGSSSFLTEAARHYANRDENSPGLRVPVPQWHPPAADRLAHHVQTWREAVA